MKTKNAFLSAVAGDDKYVVIDAVKCPRNSSNNRVNLPK